MSTVRPWSMRQSARPTIELRADVPVGRVREVLVAVGRAARWRVEDGEPLVLTRGVRSGHLLAEVVQLPLATALQRVELVADVVPDGHGTVLRVMCRTGERGLGVGRRVARLLSEVVRRLAADGAAVQVGAWRSGRV